MKKLLLSYCFLGMAACTTVRFDSPQPAGELEIKEFPQELQGLFVSDEEDTLEVSLVEFSYRNEGEIFVSGNLTSEESVLKKFKNMYVLSLKDEGVWDVFPIKVRKNKLIVYYEEPEDDIQELMDELAVTSPVKEIPDSDEKYGYYLVDPSAEDFEKLWQEKLFSEKLIFKRVAQK